MNLKTQSFKALVTAELKRRKITVNEMAAQIDLERTTIYRWLRGDQALTDKKLEVIFAFLDLKVVSK